MTHESPALLGPESSVLFSLAELLALEEERIVEECLAMRRRAEESARQEQALARASALRRREEEARVEAARSAALEAARAELSRATQLDEIREARAHERNLLELRATSRNQRLRLPLSLCLLTVVLLGGWFAIAWRQLENAHERERAALRERAERAEEQAASSRPELERRDENVPRSAISTTKSSEPPSQTSPRVDAPRHAPVPPKLRLAPAKHCVDGDPMCAGL